MTARIIAMLLIYVTPDATGRARESYDIPDKVLGRLSNANA
jgi:hypothetical protein